MNLKSVLTIAGSDSSGGAGIQADLKTFEAHSVYGMSVITALTAQNTLGVQEVMAVPADFIRRQLSSVFEDIVPDAVKIGILPDIDSMMAVAEILDEYGCKNVVLDPVLSSTSGTELTRMQALSTLKRELFSRSRLITPNIPEAERLCEMSISSAKDMEKAAQCLGGVYGCSVLLKGGHSTEFKSKDEECKCRDESSNDLLLIKQESGEPFMKIWLSGERISNPNTHGTGCTLSSAIASNLALGMNLEDAVRSAKKYIEACIRAGLEIGHGRGPLLHKVGGER